METNGITIIEKNFMNTLIHSSTHIADGLEELIRLKKRELSLLERSAQQPEKDTYEVKCSCCKYRFLVYKDYEAPSTCPRCQSDLIVAEGNFHNLSEEEFRELHVGSSLFIRVGNEFYPSVVEAAPFWNSAADEPEWEICTNNGYADRASCYWAE